MMLQLTRAKENPILEPTNLEWENKLVFNPGVFTDKGNICLIYRAIGDDDISRLGLALSQDGIHFVRHTHPIYIGGSHKFEELGIEDVRVVQIDDVYYLTYTAVSVHGKSSLDQKPSIWRYLNFNQFPWYQNMNFNFLPKYFHRRKYPRVALSTTKDFINYKDYDVILPDIFGKDASLFPKKVNGEYWLLFREGVGVTQFANSNRVDYWPERYPVFDKRPGYWDNQRVGIGTPPIETKKGWLLIYHGVDDDNIYRLGVIFLDLEDPRKVIYRSDKPIFQPEMDYEKDGFIKNVVFTCGAVEKAGLLYVYYGGGDRVISLATIEMKLLLDLV